MTLIKSIKVAQKAKRLMIGGHRGHSSKIRENTIKNFNKIKGSGIDYIEIDVQLTKDEIAVIYHDIDLALKSPLKGQVSQYEVKELKASFEINTLEEVLSWCKDNKLPVLLEIKSQELSMHNTMPILAKRIVEAIEKYDFFDDCIVFGVDHFTLKAIKEMNMRANIALIVPHIPHDPMGLMEEMGAIIYLSFLENLSKELVKKLHDAGYIVDGSVVNDKSRLKKALEIGCDMIETDYPDEILKAYKEIQGEVKDKND